MARTSDTGSNRRVRAVLAAIVATVVAGSAMLGGVAPAGAATAEWNIALVGAPAQSTTAVTIAIVDTGVDATHPAFGGRVLPQIDFVKDGKSGDPQGHGTHVAGTAAGGAIACGSAGSSAIGVAPGARILPVRVLNENGEGTLDAVAAGIKAAANQQATVINLSLGSDVVLRAIGGGGNVLTEAIQYAWDRGSIPVLAAGNDGFIGALFGSGYGSIPAVVVTATTRDDRVAGYATSVGSAKWGMAAPGGDGSKQLGRDVLSSLPDRQCGTLAGTSMATPHVAGALAVLRSRGLSPQAAVDRVLATAKPVGSRSTTGAGRLDLAKALQGLPGPTTTAPTTTASPPLTQAPAGTAPTTAAPTTQAPTTVAPTTQAPTTVAPTTAAPTTAEPTTTVTPSTSAPASIEVAGDLRLQVADDGEVGGPLALVAGLACTGAWVFAFGVRRRAAESDT